MSFLSRLPSLLCGALLAVITFPAAAVSLQRTFVSANGSDANPCSLPLPCRTFGAAITAVASNGEVIVIDSGGYGPVVINKSVELIAPPGIYAGITASAGTGIQIVSPAQNVAIRGIAINGLGSGQFGIDVQFGANITVERCRIANFAQDGLRFTSGATLSLKDSEIRDNGNNGLTVTTGNHFFERVTLRHNANNGLDVSGGTNVALSDSVVADNLVDGVRASEFVLLTVSGGEILHNTTHGVFVDGGIPGSFPRVAIDRANISNNGITGIFAYATGTSAIVQLAITRSLFVENFSAVVGGTSGGTGAHLFVSDSVFERNAQTALSISGIGADMTIASNVVTGSGQGVAKFSSGVVYTRQNNSVRGNTADVVNGPFTNLGGV